MRAVLLRAAGMNALMHDAEPHPPDVEVREAVHGLGREGDAVVRTDRAGQAILAKGTLEDGASRHRFRREQAATAEEEARVLIGHRQRIAIHAVPGAELTLEVCRPEVVRRGSPRRDDARMHRVPSATAMLHEPPTGEQIGHRAGRRPLRDLGMPVTENDEELPRAPVRMGASGGDQRIRTAGVMRCGQ